MKTDPMNNALDPMTQARRINSRDISLSHSMNSSHRIKSKKPLPISEKRLFKFPSMGGVRGGWGFYTTYVLEVVSPPLPVQLVWKNSPRGLSVRS